MSIFDFLLGKSLSNSEEHQQRVGVSAGIPMLGLDALASSAYGPEAAATVLIPLGALGLHYVMPITLGIVFLLFLVYLSYRQTIQAYPGGGGSYTVARENLGNFWGLLAAAALLLDYVLVVAVGISAGVGALVSALPAFQPHTLSLCLFVLIALTLINLRGVKESGAAFMMPTYLFVASLLGVLGFGILKALLAGGHPQPVISPTVSLSQPTEVVSLWLLARAFASGCTAMTGVEAVSNGVKAFREPVVQYARRTLTFIIVILILLLVGIAYLAQVYQIVATEPGGMNYQSLVSQLVSAIVGRGVVYYVTIGSVISVLALSANTGFADFPRMCQLIARDGYLPGIFVERGRRLVFSSGIIAIAILAGILLVAFNGVTDHLIPLFAIGAFLAFTLSQAGMVVHWLKQKEGRSKLSILINGLGAVATFITLIIVLVSKFSEGGWIILILLPILMMTFYGTRKHYVTVSRKISCRQELNFDSMRAPVVIIPVRGWSRITRKAVRFAMNISTEIYGVHVDSGEGTAYVEEQWNKFVVDPAKTAGVQSPKLVKLDCPYRRIFGSLLNFITEVEAKYPDRQIAVIIPDLVESRWYHYFLHNQRAMLLSASLRLRADPRVIIISVPWYL